MGMADLKKNAASAKPVMTVISADAFINQAQHYANGINNIDESNYHEGEQIFFSNYKQISQRLHVQKQASLKAFSTFKSDSKKGKTRNATFSLDEASIIKLANLAQYQKLPKSKLLRILIAIHYNDMKSN